MKIGLGVQPRHLVFDDRYTDGVDAAGNVTMAYVLSFLLLNEAATRQRSNSSVLPLTHSIPEGPVRRSVMNANVTMRFIEKPFSLHFSLHLDYFLL